MEIIICGPGRAGMAVGLAARRAGHGVVGVLARTDTAAQAAAAALDGVALSWDEPLPPADLLLIAVRDDTIEAAATRLAPHAARVGGVGHLSGLKPVAALDAFERPIASFHPLQSLPDPETGSRRLAGAWVGVTSADEGLAARFHDLARSLGARPFDLADDAKPLYHAGAAAAANYTVATLAMAERLLAAAGVPFEAARPLVEAVVANSFELGPDAALTGPIARGDKATVRAQLAAVAALEPALAADFAALGRAVARLAGRTDLDEVLS